MSEASAFTSLDLLWEWHGACSERCAMNDKRKDLEVRTERFSLDVSKLIRTFSAEEPGPTAKHQLAKSATSVTANYRASGRSRSHKEFTSKTRVSTGCALQRKFR